MASGFQNGHICPIKKSQHELRLWQASNLVNYLNASAVLNPDGTSTYPSVLYQFPQP